MDDAQGLADVYVLMGFPYGCSLKEVTQAVDCFQNVASILDLRPNDYPEIRLRWLIGTGYLHLLKREPGQAQAFFDQAEELLEEREIAWWHPILLYFQGLTFSQMGDVNVAREKLLRAIDLLEQSGLP